MSEKEILMTHLKRLRISKYFPQETVRNILKALDENNLTDEVCLGCGKVNCGGCPCGTGKKINENRVKKWLVKKEGDLK